MEKIFKNEMHVSLITNATMQLTIIVKMPRMDKIHCHMLDRCAPGRILPQIGS